MRKGARRRVAAIVLGTALVAGAASAQPPSPAADARQRLALPAASRDMVLAEMRRMLESVNAILQGAVAGDPAAIETAARASGMVMAVDVDPRLMSALPAPFRELGMQTHRGFDALADRVKAGGTRDDALRGLAQITSNCVACHAIYRLDEAR
jgi:cytochrome c556